MKQDDRIVVGIGEVLWDMMPGGKALGGAPANFAYWVAQSGLPAMIVSAVGDDADGEDIVRALGTKGVDANLGVVPYPTGTVGVDVDNKGVPVYDIRERVAWDNIPWNDELKGLAGKTRAVCYGTLAQRNEQSRKTIMLFLDAMPEDSLKICDLNLRQNYYSRDVIHESMKQCDILKINMDELDTLTDMFGYDSMDQDDKCFLMVGEYNLRALVLTAGADGSYVYTLGNVSYMRSLKGPIVSTVGAGDSFTAAFVSSLLKGMSISRSHQRAVTLASYVCSCAEAMPPAPV